MPYMSPTFHRKEGVYGMYWNGVDSGPVDKWERACRTGCAYATADGYTAL
jgi:hypothetical protein